MICREPYITGSGAAYPCGRCLPCLLKRKRTWTHRLMLESTIKTDNCFVTLTYDDERLPLLPNGRSTLVPEHVRDWLKRLRKMVEPERIRYFVVGEYGDQTQRAHYHAALFGYPNCIYGRSRYDRFHPTCCVFCDRVSQSWGYGHVLLGELNTQSAQYVAGYVTKKMTRYDDKRLDGRMPEFCRMSLRPGIGADAMPDVASVVLELNLVETQGDVPSALRHGSRILPLGRYLRRKLRAQVGLEEKAPEVTLQATAEALQDLRDVAFANTKIPAEVKKRLLRDAIQGKFGGSIEGAEARARVFKKKGDL